MAPCPKTVRWFRSACGRVSAILGTRRRHEGAAMTRIDATVCSRSPLWKKILLFLAVMALLPGPKVAAQLGPGVNINAANCSNSAIQTAINTARDGDRVTVPAGSCTWTGSVTIPNSKGITLQGAGSASTIITMGGNTLTLQTTTGRARLRVTGFRFINSVSSDCIQILGTAQNWRIDHNSFSTCANQVRVGGAVSQDSFNYGLIDHNDFDSFDVRAIYIRWTRGNTLDDLPVGFAAGNWIWLQPAERGSAQAVYVEDNTFNNTQGQGAQMIEGEMGAKYVMRYNTFHNMWASTHSGCTLNARNAVWVEIYGNTSTADANAPFRAIELRSVSGIVWNNSVGATNSNIHMDFERAWRNNCGSVIWNPKCDGTRSIDENTNVGYRCLGQPGWGQPQISDMSAATFQGVFAWSNTRGGSPQDLTLTNSSATPSPNYQTTYLVAGRDYFNSSDMTIGLIANRPSTCNAGPTNRDVYLSTDENSQGATLYVCTAPNIWTKHWEPFTYPHPLTVGPPAPPTNLR